MIVPAEVMYIDNINFFISDSLPIGCHPSCQIVCFLRLRETHRRGFMLMNTLVWIKRINASVQKNQKDGKPNLLVRKWATRVIESGWFYQLWPAVIVRHEKQSLSTISTDVGSDAANNQKKV